MGRSHAAAQEACVVRRGRRFLCDAELVIRFADVVWNCQRDRAFDAEREHPSSFTASCGSGAPASASPWQSSCKSREFDSGLVRTGECRNFLRRLKWNGVKWRVCR